MEELKPYLLEKFAGETNEHAVDVFLAHMAMSPYPRSVLYSRSGRVLAVTWSEEDHNTWEMRIF